MICGAQESADLVKRASFSCWALMKASLKRLASDISLAYYSVDLERDILLSEFANRIARV